MNIYTTAARYQANPGRRAVFGADVFWGKFFCNFFKKMLDNRDPVWYNSTRKSKESSRGYLFKSPIPMVVPLHSSALCPSGKQKLTARKVP